MNSPILSQLNHIASSPYRIAPERQIELREIDFKEDLSIDFNEDCGFHFSVNPQTKVITTSIPTLEYFWACSYFHLVITYDYQQCKAEGNDFFDTSKYQNTVVAIDLLKWARNNLSSSTRNEWPTNYPHPSENLQIKTLEHSANELFLCGVAWIIHHEIAHITQKHPSILTTSSKREEKEADIQATKWILEKCNDSQEMYKRTIGIISIILALQLLEEPLNNIFETHPKAFERIDYCISNSHLDEDHELFFFASIILQIQLAFKGVNVHHEGEKFKERFSSYLIEYNKYFS
jgi:hypothetical protein